MKILDASDLDSGFHPVCPWCETELEEVVRFSDQKTGWFSGHRGYCFACPYCRKILGFADFSS